MKKLITVLITAMLLIASSAYAEGTLADADKAYWAGNYAQAIKLFKPLALKGDANAEFWLGIMYENGQGVKKDYVEAVKWYKLAAAQGYTQAQYNLGKIYDVTQDYVEAAKWYRLVAEQGDKVAQSCLGYMYDYGHGVVQDYVKAHMWYNLAEAQGYKSVLGNRDIVAKQMTQQQIAEAQKLARECLARKYKGC